MISLFINGGEAQFRKFATLPEYQGKGYGSLLLKHILALSSDKGCQLVWCNARTSAINFYLRFGFQTTDKTYSKDGVDFIIMEKSI
ncbi:ribosomal-protein-alanine N-acetyltransferase [compost metagenome]